MVRRPALALLGIPIALAACGPLPDADLSLDVRFEVAPNTFVDGCFQAGVSTVELSFASNRLGDVRVPCDSDAGVTVVVRDVAPGTYRVVARGLDRSDNVLYSGTFDVDQTSAGSHVRLDLEQPTELVTRFTFAGHGNADGMTCAEAGVATLNIVVGTQTYSNVACSSGGQDAASLTDVQTGATNLVVQAFDPGGTKLYESRFNNVLIQPGSNEFTLNLLPVAGLTSTLQLSWTFDHQTCAQAGVSTVIYQVAGPDGVALSAPETKACSEVVNLAGLAPGVYTLVNLKGYVGGFETYRASNVRLPAPAGRSQGWQIDAPHL